MMKKAITNEIKFAFFGTSHIARYVLEELTSAGFAPALVVTPPPRPQWRDHTAAECAVAAWARQHDVPLAYDWERFERDAWDVAIIADYGKILPESILKIPRRGFLNVHPSLLPRLRGSSPIRSAILNDEKETGVTIILVDEKMDHGPVVAQKKVAIPDWPPHNASLEQTLMSAGGKLLAQILPLWVRGKIEARPQNHDLATFCGKLGKEDGLLDLSADPYKNVLKVRALEGWPGTYAFFERAGKKIRAQILDAHLENAHLVIDTVKPEGKNEMDYATFLRSGARPV